VVGGEVDVGIRLWEACFVWWWWFVSVYERAQPALLLSPCAVSPTAGTHKQLTDPHPNAMIWSIDHPFHPLSLPHRQEQQQQQQPTRVGGGGWEAAGVAVWQENQSTSAGCWSGALLALLPGLTCTFIRVVYCGCCAHEFWGGGGVLGELDDG
jgi:hypothetical protein